MKHIKQMICLLLSVVMVSGMLSGCNNNQPESTDPTKNTISSQTQEPNSTEEISNTEETHSEAYEKINSILKDSTFYYMDETDALAPYYEMAAERKEAILNSSTEIVMADEFIPGETYTGTAYYVSPNGSDSNNGLSPETAWKTILRVNDADLQEGDAVFFERGGVYRLTDDRLRLADYVTYSAYGEGAKPVITLSQENSARSECWELYYEGENGEKIWRFYQEIGEVGGIILDGETGAQRVYEWPTPDGWLALDFVPMDPANGIISQYDSSTPWEIVSTGEYRTVEEQLSEDMTFVSRVDLSEVTYPSNFAEWRIYGGLYLRCDAGNPGECFEDIEVIARRETELYGMDGCMVNGAAEGYVLDNLSFKWYINNPVAGDHMYGNAIIQNCTAEWGANCLHNISSSEPASGTGWLVSDGFYGVANNATFRNNYIYENASGITVESSMLSPEDMGTFTATGNLIENCTQGFRISLAQDRQPERFEQVILQDNIVLHCGGCINNGNGMTPSAIDLGWADVQYADYFEVSDNVVFGSTSAMFFLPDTSIVETNIHDNVIAQSRDGSLLLDITADGQFLWHQMKDAK